MCNSYHTTYPSCSSVGKESACNAGGLGSILGLERSPGEGKGYSLQYSCLENSMDCVVHGDAKSWTQMSDFHTHPSGSVVKESICNVEEGHTGLIPGQEDPLKEEMVTHCNILAWKIPWTEEPGSLQSMGLQRVRYDWATKHTHIFNSIISQTAPSKMNKILESILPNKRWVALYVSIWKV